jgi:RNA polymerase sigma factor (sigma-70 family)
MDTGPLHAVLQGVRRLAAAEAAGGLSDGQLLRRFLAGRDEGAFAALLHRHGAMVWGVCQRVLRHRQDAEDAFQATFLTLARKAGSIRNQDAVASWLYGVAYRLARRLQAEVLRPCPGRSRPAKHPPADPAEQASGRELQALLDEELAGLSDRLRLPLVLCFLEGKTRDEAAAALGWSLSTLKRRLERGRQVLAARLRRRGLSLGVALLGAAVAPGMAWAAGPPTLFNAVSKAATLLAVGKAAAEVVSVRVSTLVEGMVTAMMIAKLKRALTVLVAAAVLVGGAGLWTAHQMQAGEPTPARAKPAGEKPADPAKADGAALVQRGDYLVNQVARCGECHTPRDARGGLDLSRNLQGAPIPFTPRVKRGEWEDHAPDITAGGKAGKWGEAKMIKFLSTGGKSDPPMPAYHLSTEDAQAVTAYLRSLPGKGKDGGDRKGEDDKKKEDDKKRDDRKRGERKKGEKERDDD